MPAKSKDRLCDHATLTHIVVVFSDIRGFSQWSREIHAHVHTFDLVNSYKAILKKHFFGYRIKMLGDGAMLVKEQSFETSHQVQTAINTIMKKIAKAEADFDNAMRNIVIQSGGKADMALGWGITRGPVTKLFDGINSVDYVGHQVNLSARLCDLARPRGVIVDRVDFCRPTGYRTAFYDQTRRLQKPGEDVDVWVSKEIHDEFQARETLRESPEVHVAGVCVKKEDGIIKVLLAQRNKDRALFPLKWEGCGGQLRYSESFAAGVERHFRTEMRVSVRVVGDVQPELYDIENPNQPHIPGLRFVCEFADGSPSSPNHIDYKWAPRSELEQMRDDQFPPDFKNQVLTLLRRYENFHQ